MCVEIRERKDSVAWCAEHRRELNLQLCAQEELYKKLPD